MTFNQMSKFVFNLRVMGIPAMKMSTHALSLVITVFLSSTAYAEVYKWVNPDGETNYSERKPGDGTKVETLTPWTGAQNGERQTLEARIEASDKQRADRDKQDKLDSEAKTDADKIKHACKQANLRVASLERPRVNKVNADGTLSRMPEEWRQEQMAEARAAVEKYCK